MLPFNLELPGEDGSKVANSRQTLIPSAPHKDETTSQLLE